MRVGCRVSLPGEGRLVLLSIATLTSLVCDELSVLAALSFPLPPPFPLIPRLPSQLFKNAATGMAPIQESPRSTLLNRDRWDFWETFCCPVLISVFLFRSHWKQFTSIVYMLTTKHNTVDVICAWFSYDGTRVALTLCIYSEVDHAWLWRHQSWWLITPRFPVAAIYNGVNMLITASGKQQLRSRKPD